MKMWIPENNYCIFKTAAYICLLVLLTTNILMSVFPTK